MEAAFKNTENSTAKWIGPSSEESKLAFFSSKKIF
jgi:hypothetical protein